MSAVPAQPLFVVAEEAEKERPLFSCDMYYDKKLYALNPANGSQKWAFTAGNEMKSSPAIGSDGTIYISSFDTKFSAIGQ